MTSSSIEKATNGVFVGDSDMSKLMRSLDWSQTPIGSMQTWSQSLKSLVKTLLTSRYPMVLTWGTEFIQFYNDAYSQLIGNKHPAALGTDIRKTLAESWDTLGPMIQQVMATGVANWTPALLLVLERAGYREESYFSVSHAPAEDDAGKIVGMLAVCSEVTQQVLGERRLRLLRDLASKAGEMRNVEVTCQDLIAAIAAHPLDVPFALLYLLEPNHQTLVLQESVGLAIDHFVVPASVELATSRDIWSLAATAAGTTVLVENLDRHIVVPGGPWQEPVRSAFVMPIASSGQQAPLGVLIAGINPNRALDEGYQSFYELLAGQVSTSIRNAQAYEEEHRRAEMLAELDRAKTAFFSNVSHEFRTPLTLMLNPLAEALQSDNLPSAAREQITIAHRNSLRLLKLVNTLLDFSRIEAGRTQANFELTNLSTYTIELASLFRSVLEQAGLQFIVDCPPLPSLVSVDREMWEKIVLNLLSNAFKFTFTGEIAISLRPVEAGKNMSALQSPPSTSPSLVELQVRDTGVGIPAIEIPRLFERFQRVEGARGRTFEGTGIGLSLVQELVHLHSGTITVESTLGQGSTFYVRLPMQTVLTSGQRSPISDTTPTPVSATAYVQEASGWLPAEHSEFLERNSKFAESFTPNSQVARIYLVDDNADMRNYLHRILSQFYTVEVFAEGATALAAAHALPPDLVLTDVMMPGVNGFELLRQLRSDPQTRNIPILLLSARAGEEAAIEGLNAGADDYLVKPFSARELLARIAVNVELGRSRQMAARRRIDLVLASVTDLIYTFDLAGRFTYANPPLLHLWQKSFAEIVGKTFFELDYPPELAKRLHQQIQQVIATGQPLKDETPYTSVVGTRAYEYIFVPLLNREGVVEAVAGTGRDITDRKQAEVEREQILQREQAAREAAERANQIKDEFLAVLSHELRTPLNPILGWTRLLRNGTLDAAKTAHAIEIIERNAKLQVQLIEDLLDISRILRGKLALNMLPVDLKFAVNAALETVRLAMDAKSIHLQTQIDPALSPVIGDVGRLQQVVWNLLSNAVKFTPTGGRITITLTQVGASAQIQIIDTGKGIQPEFLPYVFEHFRQEDGAITRKFGGLGLGLAIARQIVELHGGTIQAQSAGENQGATFTVKLPLLKPQSEPELNDQSALNTSTPTSDQPLAGLRVLVVDDETDTRELTAFILEQAGAFVTTAPSAIAALEALAQSPPDILISDIGMPEMDGYALLRQIRKTQPGQLIPAVALTAYAGEVDQQQAIAAGFQTHLCKPVEPTIIIAVIARLCGLSY